MTESAPGLCLVHEGGGKQCFPADAAERPRQRTQRFQTCFTNWEPGNPNQRGVADAAIGGKKSKKQACCSVFCPTARTGCMTSASSYSKASTAEDGLPQPGERLRAPAWLAVASIDGARGVMQREYQHLSHQRIDSRSCWWAQPAPAPERFERCICGGSTARNGLVSASEEAEIPFRRSHEAATGRLRAHHSSSNGIPERNETTRRAIPGETRHTSGPEVYCKPRGAGHVAVVAQTVSSLFATGIRTCKAAFWHAKVRRSVSVNRK